MTHSEDLRVMIAEYVCGDISEVRLRTLEAALRDDDGFRSEFIEYMNVDAALGDLAALSEAEIVELDGNAPGSDEAAHVDTGSQAELTSAPLQLSDGDGGYSWTRLALVASVLAVLSLVGYGLYRGDNGDDGKLPIATITDLLDVQWADMRTSLRIGDKVSPRRMRLTEGTACFTFEHGVALTVEAPADFELLDRDHVTLHAGQLVAFVPDGAEGFTVLTESAEVVDRGTEFGVATSDDGSSEVIVFDGEVELSARKAVTTTPTRVLAGTAFRIAPENGPQLREFQPDRYEDARTALRQRKVIRYSFGSNRFFPGKAANGWTGPWAFKTANLNVDKSRTGIYSDRPLFNGTLKYLKVSGAAGSETGASRLSLSRGFTSFERFDATQPFSIEFCLRVDCEPSDIQDVQFSVEHAATGNVSRIRTFRAHNEQALSWPTEGTADSADGPVTIAKDTAYRFLIHVDPQGGRWRAEVSDGKRSTRLRLTSDTSRTQSQDDTSPTHVLSWTFAVQPGAELQFSLDAIRIQNAPDPRATSAAIGE